MWSLYQTLNLMNANFDVIYWVYMLLMLPKIPYVWNKLLIIFKIYTKKMLQSNNLIKYCVQKRAWSTIGSLI